MEAFRLAELRKMASYLHSLAMDRLDSRLDSAAAILRNVIAESTPSLTLSPPMQRQVPLDRWRQWVDWEFDPNQPASVAGRVRALEERLDRLEQSYPPLNEGSQSVLDSLLQRMREVEDRLEGSLMYLDQHGQWQVRGSPRATVSSTMEVPSDAQVSPTPAVTPASSQSAPPTTLIYRAAPTCKCAWGQGVVTVVNPLTIRCDKCAALWEFEPIPAPAAEPAT